MTNRLFDAIARLARRRYRTVFALAAVALVASLLLVRRLEFDTDVLHLLPQENPQVRLFAETIDQFGSVDYLLVVVRIPEGVSIEPYQGFAESLGTRLQALEHLSEVRWGLGDPKELAAGFVPRSLLFLDAKGREQIAARLTDEAIGRSVSELRRRVSTPQGAALREWAKLDPLGLSDVFLGSVSASEGPLQADLMSGFFLSKDHRLLLIVGKPVSRAQDIDFVRGMTAAVEQEIRAEQAIWVEQFGEAQDAVPPAVGLGGGHMIALGDASVIQDEIVFNVATSLIGVLILFWFAFRRWSALLYPLVPLVCGLLLTFAFGSLVYGKLSAATSGVAALLIGLAIDFVIVTYGRYVEARQRGDRVIDALTETLRQAGPPIGIGAITTAATFYAFFVTDFPGLRQMGVLTGTGVLICAVAVLVLLPSMFAMSEDRHRRRASAPRLMIHGFGVQRLIGLAQRHAGATLILASVLTATGAVLAPGIGFQEAMSAMRPRGGNPGVLVQEEVGRHFGSGFEFMMLVLDGKTPEEVLELSARAAQRAQPLVDAGVLTGFDSIASVIPAPGAQREALEWLREGRAGARGAQGALDPARVRRSAEAALAAEGLRVEPFRAGLDLLDQALSVDRPFGVADLGGVGEGQRLLERYLRETADGWRGVVYLYPPLRQWKNRAPPEVLALAEGLGPQARVTGPNVVSAALRVQVRLDAAIASALGLGLVVLLLWLDYRAWRPTVLSLLPLAVGLIWMFGAMAALSIDLNFMNIFVTTMVVGIGTDYGVHMVHRDRETRALSSEEARQALGETGKAVLLAALTTVIGFGSLSLSRYPGLSSMGIVAALGTLFTCLVSLTVLPALFAVRRRQRDRQAAEVART